jgi:Predicted transcriptional regulators
LTNKRYCIYYIYTIFEKRNGPLNIIISNSSGQPIYDQISSQIKNLIITGELKEGDALPSMRTLAKELRISVITTKRAYEELERDGFITSVTGKGSFVAGKNMEFIREEHLRRIEERMQEIVELSKTCGLELNELVQMLSLFFEEET